MNQVFDDSLIQETVNKGLWGLENLSYIPGTVGAVPVQNVGAYGVEVSDIISQVTVLNCDTKKIEIIDNKNCNFSYRDSFFKTQLGKKSIILEVGFVLSDIPLPKLSYADLNKKFLNTPPTLELIRQEIINIRKNKFPDWKTTGTAGSFFKNPIISLASAQHLISLYPDLPTYNMFENKVKILLGYVLDKICNLRGYKIGKVSLYENQALVLVAEDKATTEEIIFFAKFVAEEVYKKTTLRITFEVTVL